MNMPITRPEFTADPANLTFGADGVTVSWPQRSWTFHPIWLREQSREPSARDQAIGQRLFDAWRLPTDLQITAADLVDDAMTVTFSDGHRASYPLDFLLRESRSAVPDDLVGAPRTWDSAHAPSPRLGWTDVMTSDRSVLALADALAVHGFCLLTDGPTGVDDAEDIANRFGPIRRTNWGGVADIKVMADAVDLSQTNRELEPHADNPYRLPAPGYILLHCLRNDADGGDSTLVDGFHVAEILRRDDPDAFDVLTTTATRFRYVDPDTVLEHYGPLIELAPDGSVRRLRFNNRTEEPPALPAGRLAAYYAARQRYATLLHASSNTLVFKLEPGQLLMINNYRLLHGRRGYALEAGGRHMRQAYLDRDCVASRQKVLRRRFGMDLDHWRTSE
ncbi:Gamma-butyrobetaine,2-oxoglutarate dioxygenase [alpha proteobacterium BAL199]|jgi:gamma-butyrobetaine dioxygenase|nr:Gamma-butyrobetaine,2-oxoglutarate dioxygenase [alpha proteobacterium BAL199]